MSLRSVRTRQGWSAKLARPVTLKDATELRSLGDAANFILALPEHYGERNAWKRAIELLIDATRQRTGAALTSPPGSPKPRCSSKRTTCTWRNDPRTEPDKYLEK
jgi:hypothetical protein